jgi:hypothetical protein
MRDIQLCLLIPPEQLQDMKIKPKLRSSYGAGHADEEIS